jgi:hypothetical protein
MAKQNDRDLEQERIDAIARRTAEALHNPAVYDQIMEENRRLNAAEAAANYGEPAGQGAPAAAAEQQIVEEATFDPREEPLQAPQEQRLERLLDELAEEQRDIEAQEAIGPEHAEAWYDRQLGDEHDVSERYLEEDAPPPPNASQQDAAAEQTELDKALATEEERTRWRHQETDLGHVGGNQLTAAEENSAYAKLTQLTDQSFPPMSAEVREELAASISQSLEKLEQLQAQAPEQEQEP